MPSSKHPRRRDLDLFYVGIAPNGPRSSATLRSRVIGNHISGNTGSSTFRLTLASLLLEPLDLHPRWTNSKVVLPKEENDKLSEWQQDHLSLTWFVTENPWAAESKVIEKMSPPLNLAENQSHPFHGTVSAARRAFRQTARRSQGERGEVMGRRPTTWTLEALHRELARFEQQLKVAGLKPNSIHTYVDRSARFLKWLAGDYRPRGPRGPR